MSGKPTPVVFMGSDAIAVPVLDYLKNEATEHVALAAVISQPDRPSGRGKKMKPNPVSAWAQEHSVTLLQPEKPGQPEVDWLKEKGVSIAFVMAYGHILRRALLEALPLGFINFHASILPGYRGAAPIQSAVASGDKKTGVSLMKIVSEMDAGPVLDVECVDILSEDTGGSIFDKLAEATVPLLKRNIASLIEGSAVFEEQDHEQATYTRKLRKADGQLDFHTPARILVDRIRALDPWPGCFVVAGDVHLKIGQAEAIDRETTALPGTLLSCDANAIEVATKTGVLAIKSLQRPGGRMLPAGDFLRGFSLNLGDVWEGQPMSIWVADRPFVAKRSLSK